MAYGDYKLVSATVAFVNQEKARKYVGGGFSFREIETYFGVSNLLFKDLSSSLAGILQASSSQSMKKKHRSAFIQSLEEVRKLVTRYSKDVESLVKDLDLENSDLVLCLSTSWGSVPLNVPLRPLFSHLQELQSPALQELVYLQTNLAKGFERVSKSTGKQYTTNSSMLESFLTFLFELAMGAYRYIKNGVLPFPSVGYSEKVYKNDRQSSSLVSLSVNQSSLVMVNGKPIKIVGPVRLVLDNGRRFSKKGLVSQVYSAFFIVF